MSLSLACMAPAIAPSTAVARWVRRRSAGGAIATAVALAVTVLRFGHAREYRFEVAVISINWLVLILGGGMLAVTFTPRPSAEG